MKHHLLPCIVGIKGEDLVLRSVGQAINHKTIVSYEECGTYLKINNDRPQRLSDPPPFPAFLGARSINIDMPAVTSATTTYLCAEKRRRYKRTLRSMTGMSLQDYYVSSTIAEEPAIADLA